MSFFRKNWFWFVPLTILLLIFCSYLGNCIHNYVPASEFEFSAKARGYLDFYKSNDLWLFEDSTSRVDSIEIMSIDSSYLNPFFLSIMNPAPRKEIKVNWKRISKDSRYGVKEDSVANIGYIEIEKIPAWRDHSENVNISLPRTFFYHLYTAKRDSIKSDSVLIGNVLFTNYIDFYDRNNGTNRDPHDIVEIYWTNKYGIIAYRYRNGNVWKRINLKK
jgi:hypothetical protein